MALVFAGLLVAGVAYVIGSSNAGPSISLTMSEFEKLAPNYWNRAAGRMSYNIIQAPTLVGPAWTPDQLPSDRPAPKKRPAFLSTPVAQESAFSLGDDLLGFPDDESDFDGLWSDSPSPLGRVGAAA